MLSIKDFWNMVEQWKSNCQLASDSYTDRAVADLQKLEFQDQLRFKEIMNAYIDHADVPGLWDAATVMKNGCTDENFLYFRAWLIAQGKETYLEALRDPDSLARFLVPEETEAPVPFDFEEFLYYPSCPIWTNTMENPQKPFTVPCGICPNRSCGNFGRRSSMRQE